MAEIRWPVSEVEAELVRAALDLFRECERQAAPHQQRADAAMAPAAKRLGSVLAVLGRVRGEADLSVRATSIRLEGGEVVLDVPDQPLSPPPATTTAQEAK